MAIPAKSEKIGKALVPEPAVSAMMNLQRDLSRAHTRSSILCKALIRKTSFGGLTNDRSQDIPGMILKPRSRSLSFLTDRMLILIKFSCSMERTQSPPGKGGSALLDGASLAVCSRTPFRVRAVSG